MATINRYTIQGSIIVDQRPLTPPTPRYQVTITGGYLDDDPSKTAGSYLEGSSVTITAAPPAGKKFSHFVIEGRLLRRHQPGYYHCNSQHDCNCYV